MPEPREFQLSDFLGLALLLHEQWPKEYALAHWVWTGSSTGKGKHPVMRIGRDIMTVRRVTYCLYHDNPEPRDNVYLPCNCGHQQCINPLHFEVKAYKGAALLMNPEASIAAEPHTANDFEDLVQHLQSEFGVREPTSMQELRSREIVKEFSEKQVVEALKRAGLPIPA